MQINHATKMIAFEPLPDKNQKWIELGCGSGTFTCALAKYLPKPAVIYAVDNNAGQLQKVPTEYEGVSIIPVQADFTISDLPVASPDGIVMANALHYVEDKETFLRRILAGLTRKATFLLVEYDRTTENPWVPFPQRMDETRVTFANCGFGNFTMINRQPSIYGDHYLYSALIRRT